MSHPWAVVGLWELRGGAPQPPSDRESLRWELRLEQAPRQDRHQRGEKEGEAELRGFAGGCAKEPLEQPYGRRQCRAPPASAAPVTIEAASSQQHGGGPAGVGTGLPACLPHAPQLLQGLPNLSEVWGEGRVGLGAAEEGRRERRAPAARQRSAPHGPPWQPPESKRGTRGHGTGR